MPQIEVTFDIDANGIVNVSAKDKATGKEQQIRIQASGGLADEDIERMVQEAEEHASEDKELREKVEAGNQAESILHMTEKNLKEFGDQVSEDERKAIEADMEALKEAKEDGDTAAINEKVEALSQSAMKLGEAMYKASQAEAAEGAEPQEGGESGTSDSGDAEDATVVDAEFEEVGDEDKKSDDDKEPATENDDAKKDEAESDAAENKQSDAESDDAGDEKKSA